MRVLLLGPIEVSGAPRAAPARKQQAILALLALHLNRSVSEDQLEEALWAGLPPKTARTTLRAYVSRLRRTLEAAGVDQLEPFITAAASGPQPM